MMMMMMSDDDDVNLMHHISLVSEVVCSCGYRLLMCCVGGETPVSQEWRTVEWEV